MAPGRPEAAAGEVLAGAMSLLSRVYGDHHIIVKNFNNDIDKMRTSWGSGYPAYALKFARSNLRTLKAELEAGLVGDIRSQIEGEIFGDFVALVREALQRKDSDSQNVAAVLTAAVFEDTIRRLGEKNDLPHFDKLETLLGELKKAAVLRGAEVSIASAYLSFRNKALHAQWSQLDRPSIESALAFTEGLLMKHFS